MRVSSILRSICSNGPLVVTERFKQVSIISLNRPEKQNAFNKAMLYELAAQLKLFEEDDNASIAIINGNGGCFSVGYDLDEIKTINQNNLNIDRDSLIFPFQRKTTKPLICSVSGICKSIGFEIALMCDLRYIEVKTIFSFSNRHIGFPLLNNGPSRLAKYVGLLKATEIILRDKEITAVEALQMGLANEMIPDGTALGTAVKNAVHISSIPQSAMQYDLNTLNEIKSTEAINTELWHNISRDIKNNINLSKEMLKEERVAKLNDMPDWELDEVRRENEYLARIHNNDGMKN